MYTYLRSSESTEIHLRWDTMDIELPVLPESIEVTDPHNNETVTIHMSGEHTLLGTQGLKTITIESFFPAQPYHFASPNMMDNPLAYIVKLTDWKNQNKTPVLFVTNTNIAWHVSIESIKWSKKDTTGDIYYTLELKEYVPSKGRIAARATREVQQNAYFEDSLRLIAYRYWGYTKINKALAGYNFETLRGPLTLAAARARDMHLISSQTQSKNSPNSAGAKAAAEAMAKAARQTGVSKAAKELAKYINEKTGEVSQDNLRKRTIPGVDYSKLAGTLSEATS